VSKQPDFQRRHYKAIAKAIKDSDNKEEIVINLIGLFSRDNPNFSRIRFEDALE